MTDDRSIWARLRSLPPDELLLVLLGAAGWLVAYAMLMVVAALYFAHMFR